MKYLFATFAFSALIVGVLASIAFFAFSTDATKTIIWSIAAIAYLFFGSIYYGGKYMASRPIPLLLEVALIPCGLLFMACAHMTLL
jgi:hypothetical protein